MLLNLRLGLPIKDVRTKSRKIDPSPLVCKMSALARPLLSVRIHHKFQKKIGVFLRQKVRTSASEEPPCPKNVCTGQTPLTADVFYGRPLALYRFFFWPNLRFSDFIFSCSICVCVLPNTNKKF